MKTATVSAGCSKRPDDFQFPKCVVQSIIGIALQLANIFSVIRLTHCASRLQSIIKLPSSLTAVCCTFSVVIRRWLGDHDCTSQYNCCLPATTDFRGFCLFLILYGARQCLWHHDMISVTLISTLLHYTYTPFRDRKNNDGSERGRLNAHSYSLLLLVCVSFTITGQPWNSVLIRRVYPR